MRRTDTARAGVVSDGAVPMRFPPHRPAGRAPLPPRQFDAQGLRPPDTRAQRRSMRWRPALLLLVLVPVTVVGGLQLGTLSAVGSGLSDAQHALGAHDYARAAAIDETLAGRSGFAYLLARTRLGGLARDAAAARLQWADQLASQGMVDEALAQAASPGAQQQLPAEAHRAQAQIALADAAARAAKGDFTGALARLGQLGSDPPADLAQRADQVRADYTVGSGEQLLQANRFQEALGRLDAVAAAPAGGGAADRARALLPQALLGSAQQLIAAHDPPSAAIVLTRLVHDFGRSPQAAQARSLLDQPQPVTGTVVHPDGSPYRGIQVRLGVNGRIVADHYTTAPPYFTASTDEGGDFAITRVPVGGPYVLEFNTGGGWRTALTDQGGFGYQINVSPDTPADFAFVQVS